MNRPIQSLAMIAAAMALALPALAQDDGDEYVLDEITVTAEKREKDLQDTAISIQVYDGDVLLQQGKTRIDEIMNGEIGVHSQDSQVGNIFFMRGVDAGGGAGGPGAQSGVTVPVLIDGIYQSRGETVRGGTLDVAQVEVVRGTQSTNLGVNALAGAVSLVTNKPAIGEWEGNATIGVGNYDLVDVSGVANVPLTENSALRFAYSQTKRDGYLSSNGGESDLDNARVKWRWQGEALDLTLTASQNNIGGNGVQQGILTWSGQWEYVTDPTIPYEAQQGSPPYLGWVDDGVPFYDRSNPWDDGFPYNGFANDVFKDTTINSYSADIVWDISDTITATIIPSYQEATFVSHENARGMNGGNWMGEDRAQDTTQLDARVNGQSDRLDWVAGIYYFDSNFSGTFLDVAAPGTDGMMSCVWPDPANPGWCYAYNWSEHSDAETLAIYGDVNYSITDKLRLQLGLRYSEDEKISQNGTGTYVGGPNGPEFENVGGVYQPFTGFTLADKYIGTWDETTFAVGIQYDAFDDGMVYGTYKTGYQPGTIGAMGSTTPSPENTSEQFTIGTKTRWLEGRMQLNVEFFDIIYADRGFRNPADDFTAIAFTGGNCETEHDAVFPFGPQPDPFVASDYSCMIPASQFVADQSSTGLDVEINWLLTDYDRLDLSFEWLDATYDTIPMEIRSSAYTVDQLTADAVSRGGVVDNAAAQNLLDIYSTQINAYKGVQLQNASEFSGNLSYSHLFEFSGGSSFEPRITAEYKSEYWTQGGTFSPGFVVSDALNPGSIVRQDAYTYWNATAAWKSADGQFTLTGWIRNITDEPVMINLGTEPGTTARFVSLNAPRTYGVTFSANF